MKTKNLGLIALLATGVLALTGCGNTETPVEENVEIANPASVYCEEQGGTLVLEEGSGICMFEDGSYCEEWSYYRDECQPGEIMYNTISEDEIPEPTVAASKIYSEEDILAAENTIKNVVNNEWQVKVELQEISYLGDELSSANLEYCQSFDPKYEECAVFASNFYIPEQDAEMAGAFEPDTNINGWHWYLGRANAGEWEVLSNGFG